VLTVFPDGKLILSSPGDISPEKYDHIARTFQEWLLSDEPYPLVIGDCVVQMTAVSPQQFGML
jgi:hypothetical protein